MTTHPGDPTFCLFVYGTLMRGGCRHWLLAGQRFLGKCQTASRYVLLDLGAYPGITASASSGQPVQGELYEVEQGLRPRLDREEGAPELFRLEPIEISGQEAKAWAYFYQGDARGRPRIASGSWFERG